MPWTMPYLQGATRDVGLQTLQSLYWNMLFDCTHSRPMLSPVMACQLLHRSAVATMMQCSRSSLPQLFEIISG